MAPHFLPFLLIFRVNGGPKNQEKVEVELLFPYLALRFYGSVLNVLLWLNFHHWVTGSLTQHGESCPRLTFLGTSPSCLHFWGFTRWHLLEPCLLIPQMLPHTLLVQDTLGDIKINKRRFLLSKIFTYQYQ